MPAVSVKTTRDSLSLPPLRDGRYLLERVLTTTGRHSLLWGRQEGIDRHLIIERVSPISDSERRRALAGYPELMKLSHIGLPQCLDLFIENDALYIISVAGEGTPLALIEDQLSSQLVAQIGIYICNTINYLHGVGQHPAPLAVRPETVFLTRANRARITNLAGLLGFVESPPCRGCADEVWGVGVTMHDAMTHWRRNYRKSAPRIGSMRLDASTELENIVARSLHRTSSKRYANCAELRYALLPLQ